MPMKKMTTATFKATIKLLKVADSLMPRMRTTVTKQRMATATKFTLPGIGSNGEATRSWGKSMPKDLRIELNVSAQLTETVAAPIAYSSTSAQPMIQATISPSVA